MSLSLKVELEMWAGALTAYDDEDFQLALELFEPIPDTSRILTNIGLILATIGEHERAVDHFIRATELDSGLSIAYFQAGVSSFLLSDFAGAYEQFENAAAWLRGNQAINYEQIGLNFRLYMAEIIFNKGLCLLNLGRVEEGLADFEAAQAEKVTPEHSVIDDAIRDGGDGYTVFSIPVGVLFRPNPNKLKNLQAKDYLGKARLISKDGSAYQPFDGVDPSELAFRPQPAVEERSKIGLGRSTSDIGGTSAPKALPQTRLGRSATTLAVTRPPVEVQEFRRPSLDTVPMRKPLSRANTATSTMQPTPPATPPQPFVNPPPPRVTEQFVMVAPPGPVRGRSISSLGGQPGVKPQQAAVESVYDAYGAPPEREWTASPRSRSRAGSRAGSRNQVGGGSYFSRPSTQYTPRNAPSRRGTIRSRGTPSYEEEEGYGSGEDEEAPPPEIMKIRVRLHFNGSLRGMAIMPDISCNEFMDQVCGKFGKEYGELVVMFSDEDGAKVTLIDESDFELAIETTKAAAMKGKEPRLEIWCEPA